LEKLGKGFLLGDVVGSVGEGRVETTQKIEDQLGLGHRVTDVLQGIGKLLHLLAIGVDRQITLQNQVELVVQVDGLGLLVGLEQVTDGDVQSEREDVIIDGGGEPTLDRVVGDFPSGRGTQEEGRRCGKED
jgi:hypothetical protein